MKIRNEFTCPLGLVHDMIEGERKLIIVFNLRKDSCSFFGLLHSVEGVSQKMLSEQLKKLEQFSLVGRKSYASYPLKVEYFPADMDLKVLPAIETM